MHFKQYRHIKQERHRGRTAVRLAIGVRVSCKCIRNALKATVTLIALKVRHLQPLRVIIETEVGEATVGRSSHIGVLTGSSSSLKMT